jgi:hypothetical protein
LSSSESLAALVAAHVVERGHSVVDGQHASLVPGDETGLLQPSHARALVNLLRPLVAAEADVIVAGDRLVDVLIGHRIADELQVPFASITNADGVVVVVGDIAARTGACLVCVRLDEASAVDEFTAACEELAVEASGCVAAVDGRPEPDDRVASMIRLADHVTTAAQCVVCAGAATE